MNPKPARSLKAVRKPQIIIDDVRQQIADGLLNPGDRLESIAKLMVHYNVSQGGVVEAIEALVDEGLIETRPRRGCFVRDPDDAPDDGRDEDGYPRRARVQVLAQMPEGDEQRVLAGILDRYVEHHAYVRIRSHFAEDLLGEVERLTPDVVVASAHLCHQVPRERWADVLDLAAVGLDEQSLHPSALAQHRRHPHFVPFAQSMPCLYVNLDILEAAGVPPDPITHWEELLTAAATVHAATPEGTTGMLSQTMRDWLLMSGAVRYEAGRLVMDHDRAERLFERYAVAGIRNVATADMFDCFLDGQLAFMHHATFLAPRLRAAQPFRWASWPLPAADDATIPPAWVVLAASRATVCPQECLGIIRELVGYDAQRQFACLGGNLPIRAELYGADGGGWRPGDTADAAAVMAHAEPDFPRELSDRLPSLAGFEADLVDGRITPKQAVASLRFGLSLLEEFEG